MESIGYQNQKSTLAKLLATENITVEHRAGVKTAWFDVVNRILVLPIWQEMSEDLKDLLVVHEVGHALDTPPEGWVDAIKSIAKNVYGEKSNATAEHRSKGFLNVVEDVRIDKRQKRRFPGSRKNYAKGYQELIRNDFFGTKNRNINEMYFIDRINIFYKGGAMLGIQFTPEEKKVLKRLDAIETFDEAVKMAEELFAMAKQQIEEEQAKKEAEKAARKAEREKKKAEKAEKEKAEKEESDEKSENSEGESDNMPTDETEDEGAPSEDQDLGMDAEDDSEDAEEMPDAETATSGGEETEDEGEDEEDGSETGRSSDGTEKPDDADAESDEDDYLDDDMIPESETEEAWAERAKELVKDGDLDYVYLSIPRPLNFNKMVHDYKLVLADRRLAVAKRNFKAEWTASVQRELTEFKKKENATISYMVKEFEMRKSADEYQRTSISKTGVLDVNKLYSYKYNDDLFRRITTVASGKNHGFVMFLDWSGSMREHMKKTIQQLISLTLFCKRVQVPFEVFIFRDHCPWDTEVHKHDENTAWPKAKNMVVGNLFTARNILSSRMTTVEFNEALLYLYMNALGTHFSCDPVMYTPLTDCLLLADIIVNKFKVQSKVQIVNTIVLTDGASTSRHTPQIDYDRYEHYRKKYFIQDEITKKTYAMPSTDFDGNKVTSLFLEILKDRTGCNLLGFFIANGFAANYNRINGYRPKKEYDADKKLWKTEGFYTTNTAGYDEYYIINPKMFNVSDSKMKIKSSMNRRSISSEFKKHSEKKSSSRLLLNRFIKRIAA